jgi:TetR/AcrR family transcriptional regulator, transcriptional repressor for nem operon
LQLLAAVIYSIDYERNQKVECPVVKVSKAAAQKNHEGIVGAAGVAFRTHGVSAASVAEIAKSAGLTHGALYRHFPDKDALASAAITADFDRIVALLGQLKGGGKAAGDYVQTYLAADHRDHFVWGCPAAPLASEIHRLNATVQTAFADGLERNLDALAELIGPEKPTHSRDQAIFMLSAMAGAMALSRAVKHADPALSDEILQTVRQQLAGQSI